MKRMITILVFAATSLFAGFLQAEEQNKIAALVNNVPITEAKLARAIIPYNHEIAGSETVYLKVREKVLNQLIEDELVLQEAVAKKVMVAPGEVDQIIGAIRARFENEEKFKLALKMAELDEVEFRQKVNEKLMRIRVADWAVKSKIQLSQESIDNFCIDYGIKVHAQHILVKTEKEAFDLLHQAEAGVDFTKLAKENSLCPSSQVGGDLGFFGRGKMVKEFEEAAFAMSQEGQLSGVVKTQFGFHIIRFIAKEGPALEELKQIKENLINELYGRTYLVVGEGVDFEVKRNLEERFIGKQLKAGYEHWIAELKARSKIVITGTTPIEPKQILPKKTSALPETDKGAEVLL